MNELWIPSVRVYVHSSYGLYREPIVKEKKTVQSQKEKPQSQSVLQQDASCSGVHHHDLELVEAEHPVAVADATAAKRGTSA